MKTGNCKTNSSCSALFLQFVFAVFFICSAFTLNAQSLTATTDPVCTSKCCEYTQPCNCSAGVIASGGVPPYTYTVFQVGGPTFPIGFTACVTGLCPGTYNFIIRDAANNQYMHPVTIGGPCCTLTCRDTSFCFNIPDSSIVLPVPTYSGGSDPAGGSIPCFYDSIWNNAPNVYPVGTTVVTWYVLHNGVLDSCTSNIIRNPPSAYSICFTTSPPIVGGVINICNGQSINFNAFCSTGITGLLWNFGNGYYSGNSNHTEPASHYPPGIYYDTLTVYDACGTPHDTAFTVVVDSSNGPDIHCLSVQCPGDTVTYHTSANCTGYTWSVSGGTFLFPPSPTADSCVVIWGAGPNGTLTLNVTGCTPALTCPLGTTVTIDIVPATLPIEGDTVVCSGGKSCYAIQCIPGNTHSWELLPANAGVVTGNGTCEICIEWDTAFFGPVTLQIIYNNVLTGSGCTLEEGCAHDPGCGGTGTLNILVKPNFGISGPTTLCPNVVASPSFNGMNLTNNTIAPGVSWKLVTPVPSTLTFANSALLNAYTWNAGPGVYTLTAYPPVGVYCNDSAIINVTVVNMLIPANITGPDTVCANVPYYYTTAPNMQNVTYTWTVSAGGTIIGPNNGSSIQISWATGGGTVSVVQTLAGPPGCSSLSSAAHTVVTWPNFPLPTVTSSLVNVCLKSTVTYSFSPPLLSNATYTWSVVPATAGNILTANGGNSISIYWIDASITPIFVKLKISRCYDDSVMFPVNLLALPPVPNIAYTPLNPCKFDVVNFSTTSAGPTYSWDFGDTGTSNLQFPSHAYTSAGDFNVQLAVTNTNGCSDTAVTSIHVDDIPVVPIISGPTDVCVNSPTSHTFSQPLFPGANYTWSLSAPALGGITSSGNSFINVLWSIPGVDTVKLHVQSTCLDTTLTFVVTVHALPTPSVGLPSPSCEGAPLSFTGSGGGTYSWSFTGGSPSSSAVANPVVTYAVAATYPLSLTVTNAFGCSAILNTNLTVNPLPLAIISGTNGVCTFPATANFTAINLPGYSFVWTPTGSTGSSLTYNVTSPTTFFTVVTNSFSCTRTSNAITVNAGLCDTVKGPCIVNDSIDFTWTPPICLSQTYTKIYSAPLIGWNFGDGGSAGPVSPVTHTFAYPGIYPVQVVGQATGVDTLGQPCTILIGNTHMMTIPFDADFDYAFQCNGLNQMQTLLSNTTLYIGNPNTYNWTWTDVTTATTLSTSQNPAPQNLSAGTHVISLSIFDPATGATCTISDTLVVPAPIVASFTVSSPVCQGSPATFIDTSTPLINELSRLFDNGNGAQSPSSPANLVYINSGSFYAKLYVTDKYGCNDVDSQLVNVFPQATGTITVTPGCDSVQLFSSGAGPYTWNVTSPPLTTNPIYVQTSGFYSVTSVDGNGCPFTVGPVQVTVQKSPNATITGQSQYCQGENLDIKTSAAGTNFAWILLPSTPVGGNTPNLQVLAGQGNAGTFTYQVTVTGLNGCTAVATYTINVDPVPATASIVGGPLTFCNGDSILLAVNPPGNTYLWSVSPTPALTPPANSNDSLYVTVSGTYSVIVTTINGCQYPAIAPVTVTVNPTPPANITGDTIICEGEILGLTTTSVGGATYFWSGPYGTGNTNPYVANNMQLSDAGFYSVVVTNSYGCTNTDSVKVIVNPAPVVPYIIPGGTLCEGVLYNLCVQTPLGFPIVYNWNTGQMGPCISVAKTGNYYVTATNQYGCTAQSNTITIHPLPDLSCVPTGCYDFCTECDSVTIPGPPGLATYNWQIYIAGTFVNYSNLQNLVVAPPGGIFRLIGYTAFGCSDSTDSLKIDFHDCCPPYDSTACKDTCVNFDNNLAGFTPHPLAVNVTIAQSNVGSQGGAGDYYIRVEDLAGPSQLLAGDIFNGHWCCGTLCFDYRLFDDAGTGASVNPQFVIRSGTLGFTFTSSTSVTSASGWQRICAPITDCNPAPASPLGTWVPMGGTLPSDWTTVVNNVTELIFRVDYIAATGEVSGYDNICIQPEMPDVDAGNDTTVCAGSVITLHAEGCNGDAEWYEMTPNGLSLIGNGPIIDVQPTQNTCYVVICCGVAACCCDTDTVCVNVLQLPNLQWNTNFPSVCQGAPPILLDTANISIYINNVWVPVSNAGGTGVFSGPFVTGNYFNPSTIGLYTITYSYTDSNGCTGSVSATINVIFCCDSTSCHVDAGPDQTICAGNPAILNASGCNGTAQWFKITAIGPEPIGQGPVLDVFPTSNTCYMVVCCCPGSDPTELCCDTDIVCITVNPLPVLQWNATFPSVCQGAAPIYLDTANISIYINNMWVPIASAGGSGAFSGSYVVGNYFNPTAIGSWSVTYSYTDTNGCTGSITATINVIFCCDSSCHVDLGPDQTICAGQTAILNANGCNGTTTWYALTQEGPLQVGQGPILDVFPQQTTCYIAVCCCVVNNVQCCDTDTVCINVYPQPSLTWNANFPTICQGSAPIYLDTANISVYINNQYVPVASLPGTGVFSGPFVSGNYFNPTTIGPWTIVYTYTDTNGCTGSVTSTINVIFCCGTSCQIDLGPDQVICAGQTAILNANGCSGTTTWYELNPNEGPIVIGSGPILDVFPQQSTCYMAICCCYINNVLCCDTDTVCITVYPQPHLQWNAHIPSICQNAAPIYLDTANIFVYINNVWVPVAGAGGTGTFSGLYVSGNYFNPTAIGNWPVTYTYVDTNGCTASVTIYINVIFCCGQSCQVDAGPDTSICAGSPVILNAQGCSGTISWYQLNNNEGPILIGQENGIPVYPQQNTCYMAICCCYVNNVLCCDTDTVCITVYPHPILQWPAHFADVCLNGDSVYLNPANIFVDINQTMISVIYAGGSGVFSGPGVVGNYFYPTTLGPHVVTYTYTDPNGCTATVTATINVVFCCGQSCQVNAGPDTTICAGTSFTLNAQGCSGNVTWYMLSGEEAIIIGNEPNIPIFPQQSHCYMAVCCCYVNNVLCCDTDTVCVNVVQPIQPQWLISYVPFCLNGVPVYLDEANIFATINNNLVPINMLAGTGVFSGLNVVGNYFYPNATGTFTITYTYTDANGCVSSTTNTFTVVACGCGPCYKPGVEMINNPGFENTVLAFTSQLTNSCTCAAGTYCITTNSNLKCATFNSVTSTSLPTGNKFMVVDGHSTLPRRIWQQTVPVVATQNYIFSFWVHPKVSSGATKPDLEVRVGANVIMALPGAALANGWTKYSAVISGIAGTTLEIHQTNFGVTGYDYGIDDLSLKRCVKSMIVILNPVDVLCPGTATGSIKSTVQDGVPPYHYQWSNGETTDEIIGIVPGTYTLTVIDAIDCIEIISATVGSPAPLNPGPISGTYISACLPAVNSGGGYNIPAIPGATYVWSVPSGMTISTGQGTNSIFTTWTNVAVNNGIVGNVCVVVSDPCTTITVCIKIDINATRPVTPPSISGPAKVCPGAVVTYSVASVPRAASYTWTLPTGMTIISGAGTNVITVSVDASYTGGTISVIAVNACGSSPVRTKPVLLDPPLTPPVISGPAGGMCGQTGVIYSIAPVANAASYQWTVTNGTIVGSTTGLSISVNWSSSFTTGVVSVVAVNGCGTGAARTLSVSGTPSTPGPITGAITVCTGGIYHYAISTVVGATSYLWTSPGTIISGQGTKEVDVQYGSTPFSNQTVTVKASNACGTSAARILNGITGNFCIRITNEFSSDFSVYPNPAHNNIYMEFKADCECNFGVEMLDMTGRIVLRNNGKAIEGVNKEEIDLNGIAEGVYFLKFMMNDSARIVRIVIE